MSPQGDTRGQSRSACDKGQCGRSGAGGLGAGNPPRREEEPSASAALGGGSREKTSEELKLFVFLWIPFEFCNAKEKFPELGLRGARCSLLRGDSTPFPPCPRPPAAETPACDPPHHPGVVQIHEEEKKRIIYNKNHLVI